MEINLDLLSIQNPWWKGRSLKFDPLVQNYKKRPFENISREIDSVRFNKDYIYLIRGARGQGKTTIIKMLIYKLIEENKVNSERIFYYSCQNIDSYEQLNELIKVFLNWQPPRKNKRVYIFIDEITLIKNWFKGIEYLVKAKKFKNTVLFLAGSTSYDFGIRSKASKPIFVGLPTPIKSKLLSSLNFFDFIKFLSPETIKLLAPLEKPEKLKKVKFIKNFKNFDYFLDIYCLTGGFISSISEFRKNGAVGPYVYNNYLYWLISDLAKLNRDISLLRQIMEQVLTNLGHSIGYKTIAKKTKAKTHRTIEEYLNILESMFFFKIIYQADAAGRVYKSRAKKLYFSDPFLFWFFYPYVCGALDYWQFSREQLHNKNIFDILIKNVVFSHLIKINGNGEEQKNKVFFWRDSVCHKEIDFLFKKNSKSIIPILVRYQSHRIENKDFEIFKKAGFKKGIIISKNIFNLDKDFKIIPLVYFLLYFKDYL